MANHPSALKRARQTEKKRLRNKILRTRVKTALQQTRQAIADPSHAAMEQRLQTAASIIDKAAKKGVIHKKTAARKISRIAKQVNTAR